MLPLTSRSRAVGTGNADVNMFRTTPQGHMVKEIQVLHPLWLQQTDFMKVLECSYLGFFKDTTAFTSQRNLYHIIVWYFIRLQNYNGQCTDCICICVVHQISNYFENIDYMLCINIIFPTKHIGGYVHTCECGRWKTAFHIFINLSLCLSFVVLRGIWSAFLVGWLFPEMGSRYVNPDWCGLTV